MAVCYFGTRTNSIYLLYIHGNKKFRLVSDSNVGDDGGGVISWFPVSSF